jgi:hypothetical protein
MELCYNPVERMSALAALLGRVDEGERARTLHMPFFGHAERTTHTFILRFCASLRGHLRFQWLHVLFFGIVKPTFSPPAALCARAGQIREGESAPCWGERRTQAKKRARSGQGSAGGALPPLAHGCQRCSMVAHVRHAASSA